jgi:hypothetical protein
VTFDAKLHATFAALQTETKQAQAATVSDLTTQQTAAIDAVSARQSEFAETIETRARAFETRVMTALETAQQQQKNAAAASAASVASAAATASAAASEQAIATLQLQQQSQQQWNAATEQRAIAQDARVDALAADVERAQGAMQALLTTVHATAAKQTEMGAACVAMQTKAQVAQQPQPMPMQSSSDKASVLNEVEAELVSAKLMVDVQNTMMQVRVRSACFLDVIARISIHDFASSHLLNGMFGHGFLTIPPSLSFCLCVFVCAALL